MIKILIDLYRGLGLPLIRTSRRDPNPTLYPLARLEPLSTHVRGVGNTKVAGHLLRLLNGVFGALKSTVYKYAGLEGLF